MKMLTVLLLVSVIAHAEDEREYHYPYCNPTVYQAQHDDMIQIPPMFEYDDERPRNGKYDIGEQWALGGKDKVRPFLEGKTSQYNATCKWDYMGLGADCIGYCRSSLNLLQELITLANSYLPEPTELKNDCAIPDATAHVSALARAGAGVDRLGCRACEKNPYLQQVKTAVEKCAKAYTNFSEASESDSSSDRKKPRASK